MDWGIEQNNERGTKNAERKTKAEGGNQSPIPDYIRPISNLQTPRLAAIIATGGAPFSSKL